MTYLEKLKQMYPDYESLLSYIMADTCPEAFDIMPDPENCAPLTESCDKCWARVIPEEEPVKEGALARAGKAALQIAENCREATEAFTVMVGTIKDSGDRTQFESGAVRDMREGKGRCDLMPLEVVHQYLSDDILRHIAKFMKSHDTAELYACLMVFADDAYNGSPCAMFLEVAKHFEEGAKKYGENNWQKGIPVHCYIDSAVRHYLKWLRGDEDEPHDRAFVWNLMCCIWEVDYREKEEK